MPQVRKLAPEEVQTIAAASECYTQEVGENKTPVTMKCNEGFNILDIGGGWSAEVHASIVVLL